MYLHCLFYKIKAAGNFDKTRPLVSALVINTLFLLNSKSHKNNLFCTIDFIRSTHFNPHWQLAVYKNTLCCWAVSTISCKYIVIKSRLDDVQTILSSSQLYVMCWNALWVKSGNRGNLKCLKVNNHFALIFYRKIFISFLSDA